MSGEERSQGELQEPFSCVWQPGAGKVSPGWAAVMPNGRNVGDKRDPGSQE